MSNRTALRRRKPLDGADDVEFANLRVSGTINAEKEPRT